jgi:hypothetical protein
MKSNDVEYEPELIIGIFANAKSEFTSLDLSFLNLKIISLESGSFKKFIKSITVQSLAETSFHFYERSISNESGYHPNMYALTPINLARPVAESVFHLVAKVLLIIFPSDLRLYGTVHYNKSDEPDKFENSYMKKYDVRPWGWIKNEDDPDSLLFSFDKKRKKKINQFFKQCIERIPKLSYIKIAIDVYTNSFAERSFEMAYLDYCIALESITNSESEVTHRICRACAVLNSDNKEDGKLVYFNAHQFYSLRSAIVHGNKFKNLEEYLFNLQALVSRSIIELITLNIASKEELNDFINQYGYGDKKSFSKVYKKEVLNEEVLNLLSVRVKDYRKK